MKFYGNPIVAFIPILLFFATIRYYEDNNYFIIFGFIFSMMWGLIIAERGDLL